MYEMKDENVLVYDPIDGDIQIILTKNGSAWLNIEHIPYELKEYGQLHYKELFQAHPQNETPILRYCKTKHEWIETASHRWNQSYLKTPKKDLNVKESYMFSGLDDSTINDPLPAVFQPYYEYMQLKDSKYNQVVLNWYDPTSYIPRHTDCEAGMIKNHTISMLNINEHTDDTDRLFKLKSQKNSKHNNLYQSVSIVLRDGIVITMGGDTQETYLHGVYKGKHSRISFSCRQFN